MTPEENIGRRLRDRLVERVVMPLVAFAIIAVFGWICSFAFGSEIAGEIVTALVAVLAIVYFTPLYVIVHDYVKYEVLKAEGDPLRKSKK